jgi:hypothetical protein
LTAIREPAAAIVRTILFGPSLEKMINLRHAATEIDWEFLAKRFGSVYRVGLGRQI